MSITFKKKIGYFCFSKQDFLRVDPYQKLFKGQNLKNNKNVIIRQIEKFKVSRDSYIQNKLLYEITIGKHLKNESIVKLHMVIETTNHFYMIMEDVNWPSLRKILIKKEVLSEIEVINYLKSLQKLFFKINEHKIVLGNLTPQNIVISPSNRAKLAYFGNFNFQNLQNIPSCEQSDKYQIKIRSQMFYQPLEVLLEGRYSQKSDVWALGIIVFECLFGKLPWAKKNKIQDYKKSIEEKILNFDQKFEVSKQMKNFIFGCLQIDLESRFDWMDVIQHQIFKRINITQQSEIEVQPQQNRNKKTTIKQEIENNPFNRE